jgi:hypothetical protein
MKIVKSECEKAWLFNTVKRGDEITAGLACFLPGCAENLEVSIGGERCLVVAPFKAINSPVPIKITNARLSLLNSTSHE